MIKSKFKKNPSPGKGIFGWAIGLTVLFLIGFFVARNTADEIKTFKRTQILLGTVVEIQVRDDDEKQADEAIAKAFSEIKRIDDLFTTSNEDSPVWKFNNNIDSIITVNEEIFNLMILCDSLWRISDGCFDVAIESLIHLWGFDGRSPELPASEQIKSALEESRWDKIKLLDEYKIYLGGKVKLDFGAIAKGYAVDKAIVILENSGITSALVNAGGEIKTLGNNWIAGVQHPREMDEIIGKIKLDGISVATSGDYENYFEKDGVRYHHIIDPKTGYPSKGLKSVTVIHEENAFADGLATAVFVMGKERGLELMEKLQDTEAMIIDEQGKIYYSSGFKKFLVRN